MPPLSLMVKPASSLCNMRCSYCFYADVTAHRENASYGLMTEETLEQLLRRALAFADGSLSLAFQGGEPTLAGKTFFQRLLELEARLNTRRIPIQHSLQTNGYALDAEWMEIFRQGRFLLGVSVDGTREIHDSCRLDAAGRPTYDRVLGNIRLLREAGIDYNILCVVNQTIASHPREVFESLREHGYLQFIPCLDGFDGAPSPWSLDAVTYGHFLIETYDLYEQAFRSCHPVSVRCLDNWLGMTLGYPPESCAMAGRCGNYFLIEADGSVYPCDFYVLDPWRMGNIREASFFKLDKSPVAKQFREASLPLPQECKACPWLSLCRGGCKRDREPILNGLPSSNRLCAGHRLFFEQRLDRMQRLARDVFSRQQKPDPQNA